MSIARNAPCPCGSGRKYKQCHGRSGATLTRPVALPMWAMVGIVVVAIGATALLFNSSQRNRTAPNMVPQGLNATLPGATAGGPEPAPYQYDPATNRHWDPTHRHWHDGQPPDSAMRANTAPNAIVSPVPTAAAPTAASSRSTKAATKAASSATTTPPAPATDAPAETAPNPPAATDTTPR